MKFDQDLEGLAWNDNMVMKDPFLHEPALVFSVGRCVFVLDLNGSKKIAKRSGKAVHSILSHNNELYIANRSRVTNWTKGFGFRKIGSCSYISAHQGRLYSAGNEDQVIDVLTKEPVFKRTPDSTIEGLVSNGEFLVMAENIHYPLASRLQTTKISMFDPKSNCFMGRIFEGSIKAVCAHNGETYYASGTSLYLVNHSHTIVATSHQVIKALYSDGKKIFIGGTSNVIETYLDGVLNEYAKIEGLEDTSCIKSITLHPRIDFVNRGILDRKK